MVLPMLLELLDSIIFQSIVTVALCLGAYAYLFRYIIRRRPDPGDLDKITQFDDCENVQLDIVFVHGLGAHPYHTWTATGPRPGFVSKRVLTQLSMKRELKINWLEDDNFLKKDFRNARILSFGYNADWFLDASMSTISQKALKFVRSLSQFRKETDKTHPIVFVGHSFGGILVKHVLHCDTSFKDINDNIAGIIFLGTPHQGSSISRFGEILARLTSFSGSNTSLLSLLSYYSQPLYDLRDRFSTTLQSRKSIPIYSFYETKPTLLWGIFSLSIGSIVDANSATIEFGTRIGINTDHRGLNKCKNRDDNLYVEIRKAIDRIKGNIQPDLEPIIRWIVGSGDAQRHNKDHKQARTKLRKYHQIGDWLFRRNGFRDWLGSPGSSIPIFWLRGGGELFRQVLYMTLRLIVWRTVGTGKTSIT
ncbi:Alpha/Beta hydrolase protein [Annulohypoxylon stygium]|nr:Alpha/Beta hydrolase protein [Annulohypoxylon stygium]